MLRWISKLLTAATLISSLALGMAVLDATPAGAEGYRLVGVMIMDEVGYLVYEGHGMLVLVPID